MPSVALDCLGALLHARRHLLHGSLLVAAQPGHRCTEPHNEFLTAVRPQRGPDRSPWDGAAKTQRNSFEPKTFWNRDVTIYKTITNTADRKNPNDHRRRNRQTSASHRPLQCWSVNSKILTLLSHACDNSIEGRLASRESPGSVRISSIGGGRNLC